MPDLYRFDPKTPADVASFTLDFRELPLGVTITSASVSHYTNTTPQSAGTMTLVGGPLIEGTQVTVVYGGGVSGTDYIIYYTINRSDGGIDVRPAAVYVGPLETAPAWAYASPRGRQCAK
jgi:hypothetical protein